MGLVKKIFTQKTFGAEMYKWSPAENTIKKPLSNQKPYYCSAVVGSQGQDWVSTYSYTINVTNGQQEKLAYVECNYVE